MRAIWNVHAGRIWSAGRRFHTTVIHSSTTGEFPKHKLFIPRLLCKKIWYPAYLWKSKRQKHQVGATEQ